MGSKKHFIERTHLGKRNGETTNAAATIADSPSGNIAVGLNPTENFLNGLVMSFSNIHLYRVHVITF
jgi:hypothetical protein